MKTTAMLTALFFSFAVTACWAGSYSNYPAYGDIHWKQPVANLAALPTTGNYPADVRITLDTFAAYYWSGSAWNTLVPASIVTGPVGATDNALARFDGVTGAVIQNSSATLSDAGTLTATAFAGPITGHVTGDVTGKADTATAFAATPTGCVANQFATTIAASGNLGCVQPAFTDLSGTASTAQIPNLAASKITSGQLAVAQGGTGQDLSASTGLMKVAAGTVSASTLVNADVSGAAAIAYSKLNLTGAILNADLAGSIAASKLVGSDIATVGTITSGTWSGTAILPAKGGTGLTTLTANNLLVGNGTSNVTFVAPGTAGNILRSDGTTWSSGTGASILGTLKFPTTTGCTWQITQTSYTGTGDFPAQTLCPTATVTGAASTSSKQPHITFSAMPAADYDFDWSFNANLNAQYVSCEIIDEAGTVLEDVALYNSNMGLVGAMYHITHVVSYGTAQTNKTFKLRCLSSGGTVSIVADNTAGAAYHAEFKVIVKKFPN